MSTIHSVQMRPTYTSCFRFTTRLALNVFLVASLCSPSVATEQNASYTTSAQYVGQNGDFAAYSFEIPNSLAVLDVLEDESGNRVLVINNPGAGKSEFYPLINNKAFEIKKSITNMQFATLQSVGSLVDRSTLYVIKLEGQALVYLSVDVGGIIDSKKVKEVSPPAVDASATIDSKKVKEVSPPAVE